MSLQRGVCVLVLLAGLFAAHLAHALDYQLKPRKIAEDSYVFIGKTEDFTTQNGGNIVNTAFIVTPEGVLVIDSGPSRLYGEQMRRAIAQVTPLAVKKVLITHHHPDHFFGNQAYADVPVHALPEAITAMKQEGANFADNLYRMSGDWMKDTESRPATQPLKPGAFTFGGREFELIALHGHTPSDLAVFDRSSGVLYAGDLVFFQRTPTTPHAEIKEWLSSLDALQKIPYKLLVPGHGEPVTDARAIEQTRRYLIWLETALRKAAADGLDMPEVLKLPIPSEFAGMPLVNSEYERSIAHLYPKIEAGELGQAQVLRTGR